MDEKEQDNILLFDTLFTTNDIQLMKLLFPCLDARSQKYFAILIKYMELKYTVSYFLRSAGPVWTENPPGQGNFRETLNSLLPYCSSFQKEKVHQMDQLFSSLEMYQNMMQMMDVIKDIMPEDSSDMDVNSIINLMNEGGLNL